MTSNSLPVDGKGHASQVFLGSFAFSCLLFWWLPSILFRILGMTDPVRQWALLVSFLGLGAFAAGYSTRPSRGRAFFESPLRPPKLAFASSTIDSCESLSYKATVLVSVPALGVALEFFIQRLRTTYGQGGSIPFAYQAVLYFHLFVGFLFLGLARTSRGDGRKIALASTLIVLPRFLISLRWGRFFLAQAVVPILFIALARGWARLSARRMVLLGVVAGALIFLPALTRGYQFSGDNSVVNFFARGGSLRLFQDNIGLKLSGRCPPLLVSLTDKIIPYSTLDVCTMQYLGSAGWPATLDRILTENDPATEGTLYGTGSNFLLELYLSGGIGAIILGSALFGFSCRCFIDWIGTRSPFAGIWAECLSRALFAPRGDLGYVYERIPGLILATLLALWIAWLAHWQLAAKHAEGSATWL